MCWNLKKCVCVCEGEETVGMITDLDPSQTNTKKQRVFMNSSWDTAEVTNKRKQTQTNIRS